MQDRIEVYAALKASLALTILSTALNSALYLWRMKDICSGAKQIFCKVDLNPKYNFFKKPSQKLRVTILIKISY